MGKGERETDREGERKRERRRGRGRERKREREIDQATLSRTKEFSGALRINKPQQRQISGKDQRSEVRVELCPGSNSIFTTRTFTPALSTSSLSPLSLPPPPSSLSFSPTLSPPLSLSPFPLSLRDMVSEREREREILPGEREGAPTSGRVGLVGVQCSVL